jgi:thiamine biosynthesis lipoprotein
MTVPASEQEHRFRAFATDVRVLVNAPTSPDALRVHALFQRVHRTLTRFDSGSELSVLNARAGEEVAASALLLRAVEAALWAAHTSSGLVDPTILDALECAGYERSRDRESPAALADAIAAAPARRPAGPRASSRWPAITLDRARHLIRLPAGVRLDLGGSAKGLAVDLAADMLVGHRGYAVDAGGDLRIGGTHPTPRTVHIHHPLRDEIAHSFTVTTGAVATSGLQTRVWQTEGGFAHHLIDPARGTPAWTGVIQATALAPTALEAETLAKAALLSGPLVGRDVLTRRGGALILDDGRMLLAGGLAHSTTRAAA